MDKRSSLLALAVLVAACDRPDVLVICHNSNCVEPTNPANDDTITALQESLALTVNGAPVLDGIEFDAIWQGSSDTCLFAHDLERPRSTPLSEAADVIAAHIMAGGQLASRPGQPYWIFIELKAHVDPDETQSHTPEQRMMHAQCVWAAYTTIANAATATGQRIEVVFASFEPKLIAELIATRPRATPFRYQFEALFGVPRPLSTSTRPLSDYAGLPITLAEMHPQWLNDAQYEAMRSQNIDVLFWMFSATVETFAAIEQYEPKMVNTSEATLVRRWLER
jgi:hypothetical protein